MYHPNFPPGTMVKYKSRANGIIFDAKVASIEEVNYYYNVNIKNNNGNIGYIWMWIKKVLYLIPADDFIKKNIISHMPEWF